MYSFLFDGFFADMFRCCCCYCGTTESDQVCDVYQCCGCYSTLFCMPVKKYEIER